MKNVAQTYSLEHAGEKGLFKHLFELLQQDLNNDSSLRRKLVSCTGAIRTSLTQHMSKEEEQVIPSAFVFFWAIWLGRVGFSSFYTQLYALNGSTAVPMY